MANKHVKRCSSLIIRGIQIYAPTTNAEEADQFYEDLEDHLELTPKEVFYSSLGIEMQSRKSRDTWNNRQVWPWSTKWSRAKANRALSREHASHSKHPFQQHERWLWLYSWTSPDGQYQNQADYVLCSQRWRSSTQSTKTNLELTIAQIISPLLKNSGLNSRKHEKPQGHSCMT